MVHNEKPLAEARPTGSPRAFGFTVSVVCGLVALFPMFWGQASRWWLIGVAAGFAVIAWLLPSLLAPANRLWLEFGKRLHVVTSLIILGAMYFLVLTPLALMLRAFGGDRLGLKRARDTGSYWIERDAGGTRPDFEKPY